MFYIGFLICVLQSQVAVTSTDHALKRVFVMFMVLNNLTSYCSCAWDGQWKMRQCHFWKLCIFRSCIVDDIPKVDSSSPFFELVFTHYCKSLCIMKCPMSHCTLSCYHVYHEDCNSKIFCIYNKIFTFKSFSTRLVFRAHLPNRIWYSVWPYWNMYIK